MFTFTFNTAPTETGPNFRNRAVMSHPQWKPPPTPNPTLWHVWDFAMRSLYMLNEYDNIKAGRPVQHPNQFQEGVGRFISLDLGLFVLVPGCVISTHSPT